MAYVISDDCIACGACAEECPVSAISEGDGKYVIDADTCISCGACAGTCPKQNIHRWDLALCKRPWLPVLGKALLFFLLGCWLGFCRFI